MSSIEKSNIKGAHMKLLQFGVIFLFASSIFAGDKIKRDCTFKGKKLYGRVQFVEHFPDFKVQVVDSFPDLKVQTVSSFPDSCGKWQIVNSFPDFKVQIVNYFADFKIRFVDHFPGVD